MTRLPLQVPQNVAGKIHCVELLCNVSINTRKKNGEKEERERKEDQCPHFDKGLEKDRVEEGCFCDA